MLNILSIVQKDKMFVKSTNTIYVLKHFLSKKYSFFLKKNVTKCFVILKTLFHCES